MEDKTHGKKGKASDSSKVVGENGGKNKKSFYVPKGIIQSEKPLSDLKKVIDGYVNLKANLGVGSNNITQSTTYTMEHLTWNWYLLNVLYENNWIAKTIIDRVANDVIKNGFDILSEIEPKEEERIMKVWRNTKTKEKFLECYKWSRLYGGSILVPLLDNQEDLEEPLDLDTVLPDSYHGCYVVDRWSGVSAGAELIDDIRDSDYGEPEYYEVSDNTNGELLRIHHSRIIKMSGRRLPYYERISQGYWGLSELEHVYTELKKRDNTSENIAFLIFLANIRTYSMEGMEQLMTIGDQEAASRVFETVQQINNLMCSTGMFVMGKNDSFQMQSYSFAGIAQVYEQFMYDISGAAGIPMDLLFGRSAEGFNSGAETLQNYYDSIQEKQESEIRHPLEKLMKIITMSTLGYVPDDFEIEFNPVRRPADLEKADLAQKMAEPIFTAESTNLIDKATALKELKQQSQATGMWTNITDDMIAEAEEEAKQEKEEQKQREDDLMNQINRGGNNVDEIPESGSIEDMEAGSNSSSQMVYTDAGTFERTSKDPRARLPRV